MTDWAFSRFGAKGLPRIMLVHHLENSASCRVAVKSGYPFHVLSPANPPHWCTDGHIHLAEAAALPARLAEHRRTGGQERSP